MHSWIVTTSQVRRGGQAAAAGESDEAVLLEQTNGLLTALPHDSTAGEWDLPALIRALKSGEVRLPLTEAEERRFRRTAGEQTPTGAR